MSIEHSHLPGIAMARKPKNEQPESGAPESEVTGDQSLRPESQQEDDDETDGPTPEAAPIAEAFERASGIRVTPESGLLSAFYIYHWCIRRTNTEHVAPLAVPVWVKEVAARILADNPDEVPTESWLRERYEAHLAIMSARDHGVK